MQLAKECYRMTGVFPKSEQYVRVQQIHRAAVSIASNLAEGNARRTRQAYIHHINISIGSVAELETQIALAVELNFVSQQEAKAASDLAGHTGRLLVGLVHALETSQAAS
ncbi:MAG: four helix bundle protein [Acidobacteria bacterium]|nr:four helix bundle protein [Acidobacteriota bacterium]